ncbi:MAG: diguanylate cyclase (GGDEF)-like protein [Colwellia sp.]|jgi:diguanylate cyclase (GGDEF)-like protein
MKSLIPERQTILVIDDEKANLKILSELFKSKVNIILAKNGTQGIEKIIKFKPDLILLDIIMPGMSGFEVIMQLKKNEETSAIPVIFITGLTDVVDESQGLALGACDYIQKPFHIDIVRARVDLHLKLAEQRTQLEQLANLDSLTCVPNRRKFYEMFDLEWKMSVREKTPLSQIMIDIDYFKQYNDQYGHAAGDQALKKVAQVIFKQLKRPFDFVARYGGEEFAVLLPNTPAEDAFNIMESCRQAVEDLKIEHGKNTVSKYLTISIGGVNSFPTQLMCSAATFKLADDMLYKAKGKGRNCAVWHR